MVNTRIQFEDILARDLHDADLDSVLGIERTVQISPWARLSFEESLSKGNICRVLEHGKQVVAFHILAEILDEIHILNLGVSATLQGHGLGHMLINDIVTFSEARQASKIFLEVRESNAKAQKLYGQWQFQQIAIRKEYYRTADKGREDALILVRELGE